MSNAVRPDFDAVDKYINWLLNAITRGVNDPEKEARGKALSTLLGLSSGARQWLGKALEIASRVSDAAAEGLRDAGFLVVRADLKLVAPGLVGMGEGLFKPVFEVGLSLHPLLGLPYYPGSGLKGAVRAVLEAAVGEKAADAVFGSVGGEGASAVVFLDMLPVGCARESCSVYRGLVVTPHYHEGGEPVEDEVEAVPVPVQHVGIAEGLVFRLAYGVNPLRAREALRRLRSLSLKCGGAYGGLCNEISRLVSGQTDSNDQMVVAGVVWLAVSEMLGMGFGARGLKGYNVFEQFQDSPKFSVAAYSFEPPKQAKHGRRGRQGQPRRQLRGGTPRGGQRRRGPQGQRWPR